MTSTPNEEPSVHENVAPVHVHSHWPACRAENGTQVIDSHGVAFDSLNAGGLPSTSTGSCPGHGATRSWCEGPCRCL
eukprot:7385837-Prymnesium_polylepis.2